MADVSIVIPVGPRHKALVPRAIRSAHAQSVPCEIFIQDDSQGMGAGWARNRGASRASGDFLVFLDADDELHPQFVEQALQLFAETGRYIYADCIIDYGNAEKYWQAPDWDVHLFYQMFFPHSVTTLIPRPFFEHVGGFDEDLPAWEDPELYGRMVNAGWCGERLPMAGITYHAGDGYRRPYGIRNRDALRVELEARVGNGADRMSCSGCSKRKAPVTHSAQMASAQQSPPAGWLEAEFTRTGAISMTGLSTRQKYPRLSAGRTFWVHPDDAATEKNRKGGPWFRVLPMPDRDVVRRVEEIRARILAELQAEGVTG